MINKMLTISRGFYKTRKKLRVNSQVT